MLVLLIEEIRDSKCLPGWITVYAKERICCLLNCAEGGTVVSGLQDRKCPNIEASVLRIVEGGVMFCRSCGR